MKKDCIPPERASSDIILSQHQKVLSDPILQKILNAMPEAVLILNSHRQIVYCNEEVLKVLEIDHGKQIFGKRPGEAFRCNHANEAPGGCGTSEFCRYCGAVNSILQSQKGKTAVDECCINSKENDETFELRVKSAPFTVADELFTIFSIMDISDEKRRKFLERIFFHDILNTAGGLQGYSELLMDAEESDLDEFKHAISSLSEQLIDEINAQRQLTAAENNDLSVSIKPLSSQNLIKQVVQFYQKHPIAMDKKIEIAVNSPEVPIFSDETLLFRVLGNLLKNALEASDHNETVRISCSREDLTGSFHVHNHREMPRAVQMQMFKKSFSTKGKGRGLGTYSIKLLTEKYLQGKVSFISNPSSGTTFTVSFPIFYDKGV